MPETRVSLALTIGDPGGIGPEIMAGLLAEGKLSRARFLIIGSAESLRAAAGPGGLEGVDVIAPGDAGEASPEEGRPVLVDVAGGLSAPVGRVSREGGKISGLAVETAAALARNGTVDGIVTGPVSKEALVLAGYPYKGHTAMLARLLDAPDAQMLMLSGDMRVLILTRDIPFREVPEQVTRERILSGVRITAAALGRFWGIEKPVIMVAALNPHAGDGGINGTEEEEVIAPAIEDLNGEGIDVRGPIPADTLFHRWSEKGCDAFVALYHDQGMIPLKMKGLEKGVNMTLGLPVVRTSVCHGTAYDIAGAGRAETGSMEAAIETAIGCCLRAKSGAGV